MRSEAQVWSSIGPSPLVPLSNPQNFNAGRDDRRYSNQVLWANSALTFREEYELSTRRKAALKGATFLSQERSSFDRIADDVSRTVVTAILEAF